MLVFDDAARFNESLFEHDLQNETVEMKGDIDQLFNELEEYRNSLTFSSRLSNSAPPSSVSLPSMRCSFICSYPVAATP